MADLLSAQELAALETLSTFANQLREVIGGSGFGYGSRDLYDGDQFIGASDWREAVDKIHQLQAMVMSNAAARAYPKEFRVLGGRVRG